MPGQSAYGPMPTTAQLADLARPVPPLVTVSGVGEGIVPAALLFWGQGDDGWHAGIAWIYRIFRGQPLRALLTTWVPAGQVRERAGESYERVPRIVLRGPASTWPVLPPAYPKIGPEWVERHHHTVRADPTGEYADLRDDIRAGP
ncbi:hypothetical protein GCM10009661_75160 [Catellatospora chokoriensis]|uniref:Uncharacterized protein n=2 Tax=Catellatospora chokoriensis TaxID=310353 RepID=A0A8J3KDF3_9ACTN|nr:hypothetical protein Cch02nite_81870 [Catellatospora chokoriensis]